MTSITVCQESNLGPLFLNKKIGSCKFSSILYKIIIVHAEICLTLTIFLVFRVNKGPSQVTMCCKYSLLRGEHGKSKTRPLFDKTNEFSGLGLVLVDALAYLV